MNAPNLNQHEPAPEPNDRPAIWDLVIEDMRARDMEGRRKYGTPLQAFNGRRPLVDLYQELLDAVVYVRQEIEEHRLEIEARVAKRSSARLVIVESPYAGDIETNLAYLRACLRDCLLRGEAPFASHAIYTQPGVLRDEVPEERAHGIEAGFAWRAAADATVVYDDLGVSRGMQYGIDHALKIGHPIEYRTLPGWR